MSEKKNEPSSQNLQMERLLDTAFDVRFILGDCEMEVSEILKLGQGSVIELEQSTDTPLQLWVNDHPIAKAESVVVNEKFGARIQEIVPPEGRLEPIQEDS